MKAATILDAIGDTPHVRINHLYPDAAARGVEVYIKLEKANPGGSIKDRIALAMVEDAEASGALAARGVIIEPTSGNTGIGLAMVAAVKGYRIILAMPESMSVERRQILAAYGAELELTPAAGGMRGAIERAAELVAETPGAWMPQQFENPANVRVHEEVSSKEILADFPDRLDALVTGVGTGGHITGVARALRGRFPDLRVVAVEPAASPVISGGAPGPHPIQGIGAGFIPANLDVSVLSDTVQITKEEAFTYAARAAREEGLFVGISSGASLAAVARVLPELPDGAVVLTYCYDGGDRYLSIDSLF